MFDTFACSFLSVDMSWLYVFFLTIVILNLGQNIKANGLDER